MTPCSLSLKAQQMNTKTAGEKHILVLEIFLMFENI